jgi:hypothetical protein
LPLRTRGTHAGPSTVESKEKFDQLWSVDLTLFAEYLFWFCDTDNFDPRIMPCTAASQSLLESIASQGNPVIAWIIWQLQTNQGAYFDGHSVRHTKDSVFQDFLSWSITTGSSASTASSKKGSRGGTVRARDRRSGRNQVHTTAVPVPELCRSHG